MAEESKLDPLKGLGQGERLKRYVITEHSEELKAQSKETSAGKSKQLLTCPMYCRSNCASKHHPLLVALLNCKYSDEKEEMSRRLTDLLVVIKRYQNLGRWKIDEEIPDNNPTYRYPMIHWAATLGNLEAVKCLLDYGMCPYVVSMRFDGETALHKSLICLQETTPMNCFEKFEQLVTLLDDTIHIPDNTGNTVLHTCCDFLANEIPKFQYFQHCLLTILYHYRSKDKDRELCDLVQKQNKEGNTCLHILSRSDKCCVQILSLLRETSDVSNLLTIMINNKGQKPIDVANECGAHTVVHHLTSIMNNSEEDDFEPVLEEVVVMEAAGSPSGEGKHGDQEAGKARQTHRDGYKPSSNIVYDRKGNIIGEKLIIRPDTNSYQSALGGEVEAPTGRTGEPPMKIMKVATEFHDSRKGEIILMVPESIANTQEKPALSPNGSETESVAETSETKESTVTTTQEKGGAESRGCQDKGAESTSCQSNITITPKLEKELVRCNHFFVYLRKHPNWPEEDGLPQSYEQITPTNRPPLESFLCSLTKYEREEICEALGFDLENLLRKLKLMSNTEEDLSSKYELLQDQQMKLVLEVQKLLHKLSRLKKEERALMDSIQGIHTELSTTHTTHQGLKERLQHCNAALKVLEEIKEKSEQTAETDSTTPSTSQGRG